MKEYKFSAEVVSTHSHGGCTLHICTNEANKHIWSHVEFYHLPLLLSDEVEVIIRLKNKENEEHD